MKENNSYFGYFVIQVLTKTPYCFYAKLRVFISKWTTFKTGMSPMLTLVFGPNLNWVTIMNYFNLYRKPREKKNFKKYIKKTSS